LAEAEQSKLRYQVDIWRTRRMTEAAVDVSLTLTINKVVTA
jgi:hypothetical protein